MMTRKAASKSLGLAKALAGGTLLVSIIGTSPPVLAQEPTPPEPSPSVAPAPPAPPPPTGAAPVERAAPETQPIPAPPGPEVPPPPVPPGSTTPTGGPPSPVPAYVLWGIGGASLIAGGIFGILALSAKSDFDDKPTYDQADKVHDLTGAADVGLGLGVVLLASGTIFYLMDDRPSAPAHGSQGSPVAGVRFQPVLGPRTRGGALTLQF